VNVTTGRTDVHCHYNGGVVEELIKRTGYRPRGGYVVGRWTMDGALSFMDRHEIGAQILSLPIVMPASVGDSGFAVRFARQVNEELASLIKERPERFGAFATVPLNDADTALVETAYALDELGLDGVVLTSNADGHYFGQPFWEPILAELERRQVPVFVHPIDCPCIETLGFGRPSSVIEFPVDTARNITNALYCGVFQRYPRLRLILAHCGGALPSLAWRIAEHTEMGRGPTDAEVGPDHVFEVLRGLYYEIALASSPNSLLPTLQVTSADHVLFGTDFPAAPERTIGHNIENFMAFAGFDSGERTGVEHGNAAALFPRLG
jgi:predicted TIM-barrel fold metal-dependent hydrolase